jgi:hypothetical protein
VLLSHPALTHLGSCAPAHTESLFLTKSIFEGTEVAVSWHVLSNYA